MAQRIADIDVKGATRFYRPAYEGVSAILWFLGALIYVAIARRMDAGISLVGYLAIPMFIIGLVRTSQTIANWRYKTRLTTALPPWISVDEVISKHQRTRETFIGKGFEWEPFHARLMKEVSTLSKRHSLDPPPLFKKLMTFLGLVAKNVKLEGKHYIHGCGETEEDIFVTEPSRRSHTLVLGTNGAGKTRMLELFLTQDIARGHLSDEQKKERDDFEAFVENWKARVRFLGFDADGRLGTLFDRRLEKFPEEKPGPVFILDPKGDPDLRDRAFAIAKRYGREFQYFSPTDAQYSFRINPLANYTRRTELANRVAALLPSGGDSEAFRQFAWRAINVVVEGLHFANIAINLINLRDYVEGSIEKLLVCCLKRHLEFHKDIYSDWRTKTETLSNRVSSSGSLDSKAASEAVALAAYYVQKVKPNHPHTTIDGMIDVMMHDTAHYNKLISNLIPILVQLTTGSMETLLSRRDRGDMDPRNPTSFQEAIDNNRVVYINFESLADSIVGSALGSLFIADLTACAARRHHKGITDPPVSIFVDEAAEMMNDPFIQALNKGRAAGYQLTLASQTIADFVSRMGNEAKALQVLGNVNTTIAMRLQDNDSIQMVVEKFADTNYEEKLSSKTSTTIAAMAQRGRDYSGSVQKSAQSSDLPLVTHDLLSSLPPGHFFGHLPGGRKVKGRVLMMPILEAERFKVAEDGTLSTRYDWGEQSDDSPALSTPSPKEKEVHLDDTFIYYERHDAGHVSLPAG